MIEGLATLLGRHLRVRGVDHALHWLYPCRHDTRRFIDGARRRNDGQWMQLDTRQVIDWNVLFHGEYEPDLRQLFELLLGPGLVAADIGANVGAHTLTMARLVGPSGRVLAFEPNPVIRNKLVRNVELNALKQVAVYACALGAAPARLQLRVPAAASAESTNPGLASLVALDTPHDLVDVDVRPLDDIVAEAGLQRLDVVKIDVQGFECQTLKGMAATIGQFKPAIVFEYEDWAWRESGSGFDDAVELFRAHAYSFWRMDYDRRILRLTPLGPEPGLASHMEILAMPSADPRVGRLQRACGVARG